MARKPHTPADGTALDAADRSRTADRRRAAVDVSLDGVTVAYDAGVEAVIDASLVVPGGSITALLGPSGSGKTSLLRAIA